MSRHYPSRLASWVIDRFLSDHETLAGDILEEAARRQSRVWLWTQIAAAVVTTWNERRRTLEVRPLHLVDQRITPLTLPSTTRLKPIVNLTASPVHGTGGLGIVSLLVLSTMVEPGMWWMVGIGLAAGIVFGWYRISRLRHRGHPLDSHMNHVFTHPPR